MKITVRTSKAHAAVVNSLRQYTDVTVQNMFAKHCLVNISDVERFFLRMSSIFEITTNSFQEIELKIKLMIISLSQRRYHFT